MSTESGQAQFDFAFGYPAGLARALGLEGVPWRSIWDEWSRLLEDDASNRNNRFAVAGAINLRLSGGEGPFWGCATDPCPPGLSKNMTGIRFPVRGLNEKRRCDLLAPGASSVWKLAYPGSVGSQSLCGLPHLNTLIKDPVLGPAIQLWPFQTGFRLSRRTGARIVLAEIYPSLIEVRESAGIKDALQVEALARYFAGADAVGSLRSHFELTLSDADAAIAESEEGWILGLHSMNTE